MRRMFLLLAVIVSPLCGTTYYVSNAGSDLANGTSTGSPWQTVAKVNAYSCVAGDTILFNATGLWRENLIVPCASMTIGAYGTGSAPIITGANLTTWTNTSGNIWRAAQASNPLFPNFAGVLGIQEVSQAALTAPSEWYWDGSTYLYVYSVGTPAAVVEIPTRTNAVTVNGQTNTVIGGISWRGAAADGLLASGQISGLSVSGVVGSLNYGAGLHIFEPNFTVTGGYVKNSTFSYNGSYGVGNESSHQTGWQYLNNTVLYNSQSASTSGNYQFTAGIHLFCGAGTGTGTIVNGNTVGYTGSTLTLAGGAVIQGVGIWSDTCSSVTIVNNVTAFNLNAGIMVEKNVGTTVAENVAYGNGPLGCTTTNFTCEGGQIFQRAGEATNGSGNSFTYNTAWGGQQGFACVAYDTSTITNSTYQNNLAMGGTAQSFFWGPGCDNDGTNGSGNVYNHNGFGGGSPSFYWNQEGYYSFTGYSTLNTAYGSSMNNLTSDPQFVNTTSYDFRLGRFSPALTASSTGGVVGALGAVKPSLFTGALATFGATALQ